MKHRASGFVLAAMAVLLPLSHLELVDSDDSWLLLVDGRPVDVAGWVSEQFSATTRHCSRVQTLHPEDPVHAQTLERVRRYSPPDSSSAELVSLMRQNQWLLAQLRFSQLQNAVVLLKETGSGVEIPPGGVWSGSTHPHRPEPVVRRYLSSRVQQVPADLLACFQSRL